MRFHRIKIKGESHNQPIVAQWGSIRNPNFMIKTYFFPRGLTFIKSRKQYSTAV